MTCEQEKSRSEYCSLPTTGTCMSAWAFTEDRKAGTERGRRRKSQNMLAVKCGISGGSGRKQLVGVKGAGRQDKSILKKCRFAMKRILSTFFRE